MDLIGLTGGIASGKSTVGRWLRRAGVLVVDADDLARTAVAPGSAGLDALIAAFGSEILDENGALDRQRMGSRVFQDAAARTTLNQIVHPAVAALSTATFAAAASQGAERLVYEVPLLFENNLDRVLPFAAIILVAAAPTVQRARLMARNDLDAAAAQARIDAQLPVAEKRARATHILENDGDLAALAAHLRTLWAALTGDDINFRVLAAESP